MQVTFSTFTDGCDGSISRATTRSERQLVLGMSNGDFHVTDAHGKAQPLTAKALAAFLRDVPFDVDLVPVPWCGPIVSDDARNAAEFVSMLSDANFTALARKGLMRVRYGMSAAEVSARAARWTNDPARAFAVRCALKYAAREDVAAVVGGSRAPQGSSMAERACQMLAAIDGSPFVTVFEHYGRDVARDYFHAIVDEPRYCIANAGAGACRDLFTLLDGYGLKVDARRFVAYAVTECAEQGHGAEPAKWLQTWVDDLRMQMSHRGRISERYPDDLFAHHDDLAGVRVVRRSSAQGDGFARHTEQLRANTYRDARFIIRPPYNKEDMLDEAAQQSNCLATYADRYAAGTTDIYLMRRTRAPRKSYITVEVRDGEVRQAFRARNEDPDADELAWLRRWCESHGIVMKEGTFRALAAN